MEAESINYSIPVFNNNNEIKYLEALGFEQSEICPNVYRYTDDMNGNELISIEVQQDLYTPSRLYFHVTGLMVKAFEDIQPMDILDEAMESLFGEEVRFGLHYQFRQVTNYLKAKNLTDENEIIIVMTAVFCPCEGDDEIDVSNNNPNVFIVMNDGM